MTILITGGTGSFGSAFAEFLLTATHESIRIFSRDEHKQEAMMRRLAPCPNIEFILGDVRDVRRLLQAADGATAIVHAAALKTVPAGERHASEIVATNITGTQNVIQAAIACGVPRTIFISSDKAVAPINAYGKSKAMAESLITQANAGARVRFASVRGGNVWGSAGSVVERWRAQKARGEEIEITANPGTTRFHLCMPEWTRFVRRALEEMQGGEIFVPKVAAWALADLARAFGVAVNVSPPRSGDKLHETLVSHDEAHLTADAGWAYVVEPPAELRRVWGYTPLTGAHGASSWSYTSNKASRLTVEQLEDLL